MTDIVAKILNFDIHDCFIFISVAFLINNPSFISTSYKILSLIFYVLTSKSIKIIIGILPIVLPLSKPKAQNKSLTFLSLI